MRMTRLLAGLAALPLLTGIALAETPKQANDSKTVAKKPIQLSEKQMDKVSAGWDLLELDVSNTSYTIVSIYQRPNNTLTCSICYLNLSSPSISVYSIFGHP
jgi:hypothetical protein